MKYDFTNKQFIEINISTAKTAIAGSDSDLSWNSLKTEVEKLSAALRALEIPQGHPVVIYGHKEKAFPVAILSCIHSTIPYIPIDKIYPLDRVRKIIAISGSQILINCTDEKLDLDVAVQINSREVMKLRTPDYTNRIYGTADDPLQYIMFTSGSTGDPKGVQITRAAVQAFITWVIRDYGFGAEDVFMNQAPFTFDISLYDLLGAFALGATVVLNSSDICKDQELFIKRISEYKCTVWNSTPSFVFLYLRNPAFNEATLKSLHTFLLLGEEFPQRTAIFLKSNFKHSRVFNAYGPTEATVATTWIELTDELIKQYPSLPIGYAMPGSELFIEKAVPEDKDGELIICGDHVSCGYLKNDALNARKFFIHNGKRAFRTGDLAHTENGMFFFAGRNDDQVKMYGFRIELNEISSVICRNPMVSDAVTVPLRRNGDVRKIVCFVILRQASDSDKFKTLLTEYLENLLPAYMVPGDIVALESFPYSSSHKIDKNKLIETYLSL